MKSSKTLLGICIFGLVVAGFGLIKIKSNVVSAEDNHFFPYFNYNGIENNIETVYDINFLGITSMRIIGGNNGIFHLSQIPVVVRDSQSAYNEIEAGAANSNILGGDNVHIGNSNNITVIGGEDINVADGNHNVTLFGGKQNKITDKGKESSSVPAVLLGGKLNEVETGYDANVIVGGSDNKVKKESENVNILGGTAIVIDGKNVIAGGQSISGNLSDSFVFNDGDSNVDLVGSGVFFLGVANGVGFGTGTQGGKVISNGAVKIGDIDIENTNIDCITDNVENIGLMGLWRGCLVGCTSRSASNGKWEMLDLGSYCESICENSSGNCLQPPKTESVDNYTGFCTQGFVSTGNAHMCNPGRLNKYNNVVFETYLIDSEDQCPNPNVEDNQCVFRCNTGYHLTGDKTSMKNGATRCFSDCTLPWDSTQKKKHNEQIRVYSTGTVYCVDGEGNHNTCASYADNLTCVDGTWYGANGNEADISEYNYQSCTLVGNECGPDFVSRSEVVDVFQDFLAIWEYERLEGRTKKLVDEGFRNGKILVQSNLFLQYEDVKNWREVTREDDFDFLDGVRGKYKLCVQYVSQEQSAGNDEQNCIQGDFPDKYRYKFIECQAGYDKVDGVCRKQCVFNSKNIKHGDNIELYTGNEATCPGVCNAKNFECYDGTLFDADSLNVVNGRFIGGTTLDASVYSYTGCVLKGEVCSGFDVSQATYNANSGSGTYSECQTYSVSENSCNPGEKKYKLEGCSEGFYENGGVCVECPTGYTSPAGSTKKSDCTITCSGGYYVEVEDGPCVPCGVGEATSTHTVSGGTSEICKDCKNMPTTINSGAYYTTNGTGGADSCGWKCKAGYYGVSNNPLGMMGKNDIDYCEQCPGGYTSHSGASSISGCFKNCSAGTYLANTGDLNCTSCPIGYYTGFHSVNYGNTSSCERCTNMKPANSSYSSNSTSNNCEYQCNPGYHWGEKIVTTWECVDYCPAVPDGVYWQMSTVEGKNPKTLLLFEDDSYAVGLLHIRPYGTGRISTCVSASCEGPCGTAENGESLTCYKNDKKNCIDQRTTCHLNFNSQTRTCVDGEWNSPFDEDYVYSNCSLSLSESAIAKIQEYKYMECPSSQCYSEEWYSPGPDGQCINDMGYKPKCPDGLNRNGMVCVTAGGSCFLAGTPVLTSDGSKNIEDIEVGDMVLSYNANHKIEYNKVLKKIVHENSIDDVYTFVIDGDVIEATALHPFYVAGSANRPYQCNLPYRWKSAKNLKVGEQLMMSDGKLATIDEISHRSNFSTTYNLSVENAHTYFVGKGYLVHNVNDNPGGGKNDMDDPPCMCVHNYSTLFGHTYSCRSWDGNVCFSCEWC